MNNELPRVAPQDWHAIDEPRRSNLPLLLIAATFLCLTIALVVLQPMLTGEDDNFAAAETTAKSVPAVVPAPAAAPAPERQVVTAEPTVTSKEETVTRAAAVPLSPPVVNSTPEIDLSKINANAVAPSQFALFANTFTPLDRVTSAVIKQQLRQPIRLINSGAVKRDVPTLANDVISLLSSGSTSIDPRLRRLISEAVLERQSDDYIRELVNTVAKREALTVPVTLRTTDGQWEVYSLLKGMAQLAGGPAPKASADVETNGTQRIVPGDSLARIALRYYGQPFKYDIILAANPQIDPQNPVLRPGDYIQMPKP